MGVPTKISDLIPILQDIVKYTSSEREEFENTLRILSERKLSIEKELNRVNEHIAQINLDISNLETEQIKAENLISHINEKV